MSDKTTPRPWSWYKATDQDNAEGEYNALEGATGTVLTYLHVYSPGEPDPHYHAIEVSEADARLIVHAVNYHDRLRGLLARVLSPSSLVESRKLLAKIETTLAELDSAAAETGERPAVGQN